MLQSGHGMRDGRTDGQMDWRGETNITPNNFVVWGYKNGRQSENVISITMMP